ILAALFIFILLEKNIPVIQQVLATFFILVTLVNCGAIMEQKTWIVYLEFSRLVLVLISVMLLYPKAWLAFLLIGVIYLIYYYFRHLQFRYLKLVYATSTTRQANL
ncbi:MAG: sterol desaturase, partial [Bacteroidota bacterium]